MKYKRGEFSKLSIILSFMKRGMGWGFKSGFLLGALFPAIIMLHPLALVFAPAGAFYGVVVGIPTGLFAGAVLGLLTVMVIVIDTTYYRYMMRVVGCITTVLCSSAGFYLMFDREWNWRLTGLSSLIAGLAAIYVSNRMVDWWLGESSGRKKKKNDETQPGSTP